MPGNVCEIFATKNGMFEETIKAFKPKILCPLMPGNYSTSESTLNLAPFTMFPTDGFIWLVTIKVVSGVGKKQKLVMCITVEAKITKIRNRKG